MITRVITRQIVDFYTNSQRIAHAYRRAIQRNTSLARHAEIQELGQQPPANDKHADGFGNVVLSHADDDHVLLTNSGVDRVVSGAFHLLFTGQTTHPDQVAQWMRTTNIRAENRLHVIKMDDLEAPQMSQLLGRVCSALLRDDNHGSIIDAYIRGATLLVRGPKHRMLHVPIESVKALRGQPHETVRNFTIDPDGSFLYWPELDVHLGWSQLLQAVDPAELRKAEQKSAEFNERYGRAIRNIREAAGIPQSKVDGLTERQLRRIERGDCRATTSALTALAKIHGLGLNAYMDKLTKAMQ